MALLETAALVNVNWAARQMRPCFITKADIAVEEEA